MSSTRSELTFKSYRVSADRRSVVFRYALRHAQHAYTFVEQLDFPKAIPKKIPSHILKQTLQALHLVLGVGYYKTYMSKQMRHPYRLTKEQALYWTDVYRQGLGEMCYRNDIDPKRIARFTPTSGARDESTPWPRQRRVLLGIGGGKDSIVAGEWLKRSGWNVNGLHVSHTMSPIISAVTRQLGFHQTHVRRTLDPQLLQPFPGGYSGHVPISAIYAWIGILTALIEDRRYVVVGNEWSSDSGNVQWKGHTINHQWSKSSEFERRTQEYLRRSVTPDVEYVSVVRPYYELRLLQEFTKYPKYFSTFSSCNRNYTYRQQSNGTRWCGACPKCAFAFVGLTAFLPLRTVVRMFGRNLLDDEKLLPIYRDELGFGRVKPWECVGTFEETRAALTLAASKSPKSIIVRTYAHRANMSTEKIAQILRRQPNDTVSSPFILLGVRSAVLVGYAREGKATHMWLRRRYPWMTVAIRDQSQGRNYLKGLEQFDIAIKTPGIPGRTIPIPYTTATELFFGHTDLPIIGVTGTKGKSTTSSLIAHLLKSGGKKSVLVGNIGRPMLEQLLLPLPASTIFVAELSSYQLQDLRLSPATAVVLNLFTEHVDYHGSREAYAAAKAAIVVHQRPSDLYIYNPRDRFARQLAKKTVARTLPWKQMSPGYVSRLQGLHNQENIAAAVMVARSFGVGDAALKRGLTTFQPLPHRLQAIGTYRGVQFVDDAISTTPESTIAALRALPATETVFLGGTDRGYDFRELEAFLKRTKVKNIVLFPDTGRRILRSTAGYRILHTKRMRDAVMFAYRYTSPKALCLLSCASPSYSVWENFEVKGNEFQYWVHQLGKGKLKNV